MQLTRNKLKTEIKELKCEVKELKTENAALKKKNAILRNENSKLRSKLGNDSSNSSLSPSTDKDGKVTKRVNEYNSRTKSGKSAGTQDRHKRHSLSKSDAEKILKEGKAEHVIGWKRIKSLSTLSSTQSVDTSP